MQASQIKMTEQRKHMHAFADQYPAYFDHALACIKAWGESGRQLQHCMAIALKDMYERGQRNDPPSELGLSAPYQAYADRLSLFAIDCKPSEGKARRVARTPPAPPPSVQRIARAAPVPAPPLRISRMPPPAPAPKRIERSR